MTQDELIARQAQQLEELRDRVVDFERRMQRIHGELFCIGGPLNDNVLSYSRDQLGPFRRIAEQVQE